MWKRSEFLSENFQFLVVKFSIYLNRLVFVMSPGHSASTMLRCSLIFSRFDYFSTADRDGHDQH